MIETLRRQAHDEEIDALMLSRCISLRHAAHAFSMTMPGTWPEMSLLPAAPLARSRARYAILRPGWLIEMAERHDARIARELPQFETDHRDIGLAPTLVPSFVSATEARQAFAARLYMRCARRDIFATPPAILATSSRLLSLCRLLPAFYQPAPLYHARASTS